MKFLGALCESCCQPQKLSTNTRQQLLYSLSMLPRFFALASFALSICAYEYVPGGVSSSTSTAVVGAPFENVQSCDSANCSLVLGAVSYEGPSIHFSTRGYNGGMPGPTIRASAGDTVTVHVTNSLQDIANGNDLAMNLFRHLNTTNIHTHGLHVSSVAPGDDPFQQILPGGEKTSHFEIPAFHMGGTVSH